MYKIKTQIKLMAMTALAFVMVLLGDGAVHAASADNSLSSIQLSEGTLSPNFVYNVVNYSASVGSDTESIEVSAKTSNAKAQIQSGTGTYQLKAGENTIKIVVAAENGNLATYTIRVTRDGSAGSSAGQNANPQENSSETADEPESGNAGEQEYAIKDSIPEDKIPADFTQTTAVYQGEEHSALAFDKGAVTLLYMENEQGGGGLFVYDETDGDSYPFVKLTAGENYLILLKAPAQESPGENFIASDLVIDGVSAPSSFQPLSTDMPDFYQVYGMSNSGASGWYQYDSAEGTYQRFHETAEQTQDTEMVSATEHEFLRQTYNELSEKYSGLKQRDTRYMAILIIAIAVLLIIIVNLLLFRGERKTKTVTQDEIPGEGAHKKTRQKKTKQPDTRGSSELFDGFDEEPEFLSGSKAKPEEKSSKGKKRRFGRRDDIFDEQERDDFFDDEVALREEHNRESSILDDDFEIMDLNDL